MEDKIFNVWLAGFWEGEGSIFKRKGSNRGYCISLSQSIDSKRTVELTMGKIQKTFGGGITNIKFINENHKPQLMWRLTKREDIIKFINTIYPYCNIRKTDLKNCLEYFENHPSLKWNKIIDLEKVNKLLSEGKTYKQIGKIFNVCAKTIFYKYKKYYSYKRQRFSRRECVL